MVVNPMMKDGDHRAANDEFERDGGTVSRSSLQFAMTMPGLRVGVPHVPRWHSVGARRVEPVMGNHYPAGQFRRMPDLWRAIAPSGLAAAIMYASIAGARLLLPPSLPRILALYLVIATGAVAYGLGSFLFNRRGSREVLRLLRSATRADTPTSSAP